MRIEHYFRLIQKSVESCPANCQKLHMRNGVFVDSSTLYWCKFVDVEITEDRLMYVYQYMDSSDKIVFRYDNTGHQKKLGLSTYPHHEHEGSEDNSVPSTAPDLDTVLREIESLVRLP